MIYDLDALIAEHDTALSRELWPGELRQVPAGIAAGIELASEAGLLTVNTGIVTKCEGVDATGFRVDTGDPLQVKVWMPRGYYHERYDTPDGPDKWVFLHQE